MPKCNKKYVLTNIGFYWILLHSFFYPSVFYMSYRFVLSLTLLFLSSISKKNIVLQHMNYTFMKIFTQLI